MRRWQCTACKTVVEGNADYFPGVCPGCTDPYARWIPAPAEPTAGAANSLSDLVAYINRQIEFSYRTFGPGRRTKGVIDHIRKELKEIEADPADVGEWVDIIILGLDGAWRTGASARQIADALQAKQTKNANRTWPNWRTMGEDQAIEHDRSAESAAHRHTPGCGHFNSEYEL